MPTSTPAAAAAAAAAAAPGSIHNGLWFDLISGAHGGRGHRFVLAEFVCGTDKAIGELMGAFVPTHLPGRLVAVVACHVGQTVLCACMCMHAAHPMSTR